MAGHTPKGVRYGGRGKNTPNKRTVQKMIEASRQVAEVKKLGQKKATEVLQDLINTSMGMVALYQRKVMTSEGMLPNASPADVETMRDFMLAAGVFAKALAPFQDPTFRAITFMTPPPQVPAVPGDNAKLVPGKVVKMDDPNEIVRIYQQMMRRTA